MLRTLRFASHIIPASSIRKFYGKDGGQLRIAVNSYDPIENNNPDSESKRTTMMFVAANGFHKEIYEPIIKDLSEKRERWNGGTMLALDGTNQGDSAVANQDILPDSYSWLDLSYDILQVIDYFNIKGPIIGVGHSLGGCTMLMAEILRPGTFSSLVTIDPVIYPYKSEEFKIAPHKLALLALNRRDTWPNRETAKESFIKRSFYKCWDPEVLDLHIQYGLRDLPSGEVTLKCPRIQEYYTFENDEETMVETFQRLHEIQCPVLFIIGKKSTALNPQDMALLKVSRCKHGDLKFLDTGHLVIMEKPRETTKEILNFISHRHSKISDEKNSNAGNEVNSDDVVSDKGSDIEKDDGQEFTSKL